MNTTRQSFFDQPQKFSQLIWDYKLSPQDFFAILDGEKSNGWFTQDWAIARVLDNLNYYEAMSLVSPKILSGHWPTVKKKLFKETIRDGYEFVLQRQSLSVAR
ncbi:MAG: hypothetical protein AAB506_02130 [Patescibacteria group bacterium]